LKLVKNLFNKKGVFLLFLLAGGLIFVLFYGNKSFVKSGSQSIFELEATKNIKSVVEHSKAFIAKPEGFLVINHSFINPLPVHNIINPTTLGVFYSEGIDTNSGLIRDEKAELIEYEVEEGDTLDSISQKFNITKETIIWANDLSSNKLTPGQKLTILPVSGVLHLVKQGETLSEIAKWYKVSIDEIVKFNNIDSENRIIAGDLIIIPNGKKINIPSSSPTPIAESYFISPVDKFIITQGLHYYNAVDLGASCGTPVRATAGGTIQASGYHNIAGNYIRIIHSNGVITFYGHLSGFAKRQGNVTQGEIIGYIGKTGLATGCHLHFEVRGAKNPFLK
jgi:LysM repeat protein